MVQLSHTNAQLKKIVEYNHGLVGEVVSKLRDDLVRPFFMALKKHSEEVRQTSRHVIGRRGRARRRAGGRARRTQRAALSSVAAAPRRESALALRRLWRRCSSRLLCALLAEYALVGGCGLHSLLRSSDVRHGNAGWAR